MYRFIRTARAFQKKRREHVNRMQVQYKELLFGLPPGQNEGGNLTKAVPPDLTRLSKLLKY